MGRWQGRSLRKATGGKIWQRREKKKSEMGTEFIEARLAPTKQLELRTFGGGRKLRLLSSDVANVMDPKTSKVTKSKITTVSGNPADPHFVRRNVLTKGAIITTEIGKARITNRPGQDGMINAILIEPKQ